LHQSINRDSIITMKDMQNKKMKEAVNQIGFKIALSYIKILEEGRTPALLSNWIDGNKYDYSCILYEGGNLDNRYSLKTICKHIESHARWAIKSMLDEKPELKKLLIRK